MRGVRKKKNANRATKLSRNPFPETFGITGSASVETIIHALNKTTRAERSRSQSTEVTYTSLCKRAIALLIRSVTLATIALSFRETANEGWSSNIHRNTIELCFLPELCTSD